MTLYLDVYFLSSLVFFNRILAMGIAHLVKALIHGKSIVYESSIHEYYSDKIKVDQSIEKVCYFNRST
mgnify:CR=1 FL=1